jgi:hypothetical protein
VTQDPNGAKPSDNHFKHHKREAEKFCRSLTIRQGRLLTALIYHAENNI